jgi:hypothetical protein
VKSLFILGIEIRPRTLLWNKLADALNEELKKDISSEYASGIGLEIIDHLSKLHPNINGQALSNELRSTLHVWRLKFRSL